MKNLFFAVFVFFSVLIFAENEPTLEAFFEKTLEEEKIFFNDLMTNDIDLDDLGFVLKLFQKGVKVFFLIF